MQLSAATLANYICDAARHHLDPSCNIFRPTWSLSLCSGILRVGSVKSYPHIIAGPCLALCDNYGRPIHTDYPLPAEVGPGHVCLHLHADRYLVRGENYTIGNKSNHFNLQEFADNNMQMTSELAAVGSTSYNHLYSWNSASLEENYYQPVFQKQKEGA